MVKGYPCNIELQAYFLREGRTVNPREEIVITGKVCRSGRDQGKAPAIFPEGTQCILEGIGNFPELVQDDQILLVENPVIHIICPEIRKSNIGFPENTFQEFTRSITYG